MTATDNARVAAITTGLDRLKRSLRVGGRTTAPYDHPEPRWETRFVQNLSGRRPTTTRLADFGYRDHELPGRPGLPDDLAMAGPVRLLTDDGARALRDICRALKPRAVRDDHGVPHRLRDVESLSPFVHAMVRDAVFLDTVSRLVGVPLVPHPLRDAGVQTYYYGPPAPSEARTGAAWHLDGMNYVFTMTLSDRADHDGGAHLYFKGHPDDFDAHREDITRRGPAHPRVHKAPFLHVGDTMFTRGSRVYHAVTPVTRGERVTLAVSLFCPLLGGQDENRFWHSAPDDGLLRTLRNWNRLRRAVHRPAHYCRREEIPIVPLSGVFPRQEG
ncbi:hypothetical protein [Streptomyces sp. NPDC088789]|uniref:hypothetical protein n=1 Tax=Streptomyces sp. NPDC088789 TaxID=3365899 RepID=UPI0037F9D05E